jgi:hypothetical protein
MANNPRLPTFEEAFGFVPDARPEQARYDAIGEKLIDLLKLHVKENGRVDTSWGDKTAYGLALTVKRIIEEGESHGKDRRTMGA